MSNTANRNFLFLQGPHGPFFRHLGRMLAAAGAEVWRVGFNAGDRAFWPRDASFIAYKGVPEDWQAAFSDLLDEKGITDIVLYGDTRPIHALAHAALIAYPRYLDPVTGLACPVEVALERLETDALPAMPFRTRIASEIQDLMALLGLRR